MKELIDKTRLSAEKLIKKFKIDGVCFIPPTVKREVQFMNELKKKVHLAVKEITVTKIKTDIIVPQKTLNKLNDRIENAERTFAVGEVGNVICGDIMKMFLKKLVMEIGQMIKIVMFRSVKRAVVF